MFIEIIKAALFGVIEGITEWLPISSTGHMILAEEFIHLKVSTEFWNMFLVVIQLGAILSVVVLYWKKLWPFYMKNNRVRARLKTFQLWFKVIVATIPAMILGLAFNDMMEKKFTTWQVVSVALIVYGVVFIIVENHNKHRRPTTTNLEHLHYSTALGIGVFQVLSLIPGTSRSGSTIIGGMLLGTSREVVAEFTFFLAIPVMFGASLLRLVKFGFHFTGLELSILLVGMVVAFFVSIVAIRFLMGYIKKHNFKVFGYYRILLGIVVIAYFLMRSK